MDLLQVLYYVLLAAYWILVISSVSVVLLENKNPVRTTAWILVLTTVPFIGLLLYIVFGRSYHRQSRLSRKTKSKIQVCMNPAIARTELATSSKIVKKHAHLIKLLETSSEAKLFANNNVEIYTNGKKLFADILNDIENAKNHIHAEYYIVETDKTGNKFKDALIKKAREGVEVRLIYDDIGSWRLKYFTIKEMQDAGIKLQSFFKLRFPYFTNKLNYRNHRKILVIDGKIGYLGGFNIADRYTDGLDWGIWKDTHIRFEGDGVAGLQNIYLTDWLYVTQKLHQTPRFFPVSSCESKTSIQVVGSGPDTDRQSIMQGFCYAINDAKKYIYIQTPYFLPNESILTAIESAAMRGIDVRLMIPSRSDSRISYEASLSYMREILSAGVKVLQYKKGFIHAKTIVIDDEVAIIGSANMDFRSFEQNFEVSAFIYDEEKSVELRNIFLVDEKSCRKLTLWKLSKTPKFRKVIRSIARLFSPAL